MTLTSRTRCDPRNAVSVVTWLCVLRVVLELGVQQLRVGWLEVFFLAGTQGLGPGHKGRIKVSLWDWDDHARMAESVYPRPPARGLET